ncbi:MAG: hypothetical protein Q8P41_32160 [Pseudomonadota bacterium]|nr:hypothetical protein [Pseudomonadota bacterium]
MASDPYGFPDTAAGGASSGAAIVSLWTGIAALVCGVVGPCLCYLPWFAALPLSVVALWYGTQAKQAPASGEGLDAAATAGLVSGAVALLFSLLYLGLILFYVGLVVVMAASDM